MAQGISTAVSIVDGLTRPMQQMRNSVNGVVNSFLTLNGVANNTNITNPINGATIAQSNLNDEARESVGLFSSLKGQILGLVGAYASFSGASSLISQTDTLTNIKSRLDLINDGLQTTDELQNMIMQSANNTFSSFEDTADMIGKLGIQAGEAFSNNQDIINFAEQINKHLAIAGTSGAAAQGAMIQLTQAMSNGVLRGEELNSVLDGMPTVVKLIREEFARMGDTRGIKEIAEEGLITADIVKRALYNAADETNKKFNDMSVTFTDVWNLFKNNSIQALKPLFTYLSEIGNSQGLRNFAKTVGTVIGTLGSVLVGVFKTIGEIGSFVAKVWKYIAPVVYGVVAPVLAYKTALIGAWVWTKIMAGAYLIWGAITKAITVAKIVMLAFTNTTKAGTLATAMFNATWLANPITWILLGVIAVLGVVIGLVFYFADSWQEAVGIISGAIAVFGAFVINHFGSIYNVIASVVEFFANVWNNPIYSVKQLFANLTTNILDMCISMTKGWDGFATSIANGMIEAVNTALGWWNKLVDALPDSVTESLGLGKVTTIKQRVSITSDLENMKKGINDWVSEAPSDYWNAPKFKHIELGSAYDTGKKWGENKANELSVMMDTSSIGGDTSKGSKELLSNIANNTKATAKNTGTYEEELKYMRDIAEREAINRFTTAEIKIGMTNNNSISKDMDIDTVINSLTSKLSNAMSIAAEGEHY